MLKHHVNARAVALTLGVLIYTTLQTGAVSQQLEKLWAVWWPSPSREPAVGVKIVNAVLLGIGLITIVVIVEYLAVCWKTRRIRGEWIYKEGLRDWGHVRICLKGPHLQYSVDLYESKADLLKAIRHKEPVLKVRHGDDRMSLYVDGKFYTWYQVKPSFDYEGRQGILTLEPMINPDYYSAHWERTGPLQQSPDTSPDPGPNIAPLPTRGDSVPAGTFPFFVSKKVFLRQACKIPG